MMIVRVEDAKASVPLENVSQRLNLAKGVLRMMIVRAKTVMVMYFGGSRVVNVQRASAMRRFPS